jgi:hypothetical protein
MDTLRCGLDPGRAGCPDPHNRFACRYHRAEAGGTVVAAERGAVPLIKQRRPALPVVIMSLDDASVAMARRMPSVDGVVHKEQLVEEFLPLVRQLLYRLD